MSSHGILSLTPYGLVKIRKNAHLDNRIRSSSLRWGPLPLTLTTCVAKKTKMLWGGFVPGNSKGQMFSATVLKGSNNIVAIKYFSFQTYILTSSR